MTVGIPHTATGLAAWAAQQQKLVPRQFRPQLDGIRFAFYGRMSTTDFQDKASSWRWQRSYAEELIADHGRIVAEFFDEGVSRRVAWPDRPQAGSLLAALADPNRGFEAIVVGEFERAFHGQQLSELAPLMRRHEVQLWLPETYGPVDFGNPRHLALLDLLGVHSRREISRARYRTTAAMTAQAQLQGRHLGGRPPYGYMLVDAGPHPNRAHARWGRRLHRLEPDPVTAPTVRQIFAQRLEGRSVASIARQLNDDGVPCPSNVDRERNQHRSGEAWMLTTVLAILSNPRYTGRQVWNRQRTERAGLYPYGAITRHEEVQRWNPSQQWAISEMVVHPPLVSEEDFVAVQDVHTAPVAADGTTRSYALAGLVFCGICGRVMDSHWVHQRAAYRCRHGHNSTRSANAARRKILYLREDQLVSRIQHERNLHLDHRQLRDADPEVVAEYLATHNMIIVCDHDNWVIETEAATIRLAPNVTALFGIPAVGTMAEKCPKREGKS
ncbi:recombinase family protein [Allorhizocola rhizosphaerae]|uniref:recombinase family protein n=1 Tax=Allorhizocola rhizosphaerae TaxID=1872709 RepID=UPI001FEA6A7A|nr:recombinase family protein [Allorhizocola rhizosphaerae]